MITETQTDVLRFVVSGWRGGLTPSVREISAHFGWSSQTTAHDHILRLTELGYLEPSGRPRPPRILPKAIQFVPASGSELGLHDSRKQS